MNSKERIQRDIEQLSTMSEPCACGVTRPSYTPSYRRAADYVVSAMEQSGLEVREDDAGNIFGTLVGKKKGRSRIISGSHLDTVRGGGAFDGAAGIVCALEVSRLLRDRKIELEHTYEVAAIVGEEGTRFGQVLMGSKIITGALGPEKLDELTDQDGASLRQALLQYHGRDAIQKACRKKDTVKAFLELHIEQGNILERNGEDIGIVRQIQGVTWLQVEVEGHAGHAGALAMDSRQDAGIAAFRMITALHDYVVEKRSGDTRMTVGRLELLPGSSNVVPGKCLFTVDIRSSTTKQMQHVIEYVQHLSEEISGPTNTAIHVKVLNKKEPVFMDGEYIEVLREAACASGCTSRLMDSGAGHDAMVFAEIWKTAMLFIPSRCGITHHPDEFTPYEYLQKGAEVLLQAVLKIDATQSTL